MQSSGLAAYSSHRSSSENICKHISIVKSTCTHDYLLLNPMYPALSGVEWAFIGVLSSASVGSAG